MILYFVVMLNSLFQDALLAAIAAIGFAAVSNPPRCAYIYCGLIAAVGHSARFLMMEWPFFGFHIVIATTMAAFIIGLLAVFISHVSRIPSEICLFPAMLPMIPGVYAYKTFCAVVMCLYSRTEQDFSYYFYLFSGSGLTCLSIFMGMVAGATFPILIFKNISFKSTRQNIFFAFKKQKNHHFI